MIFPKQFMFRVQAALCIVLCCAMDLAHAAALNYSWPSDLTRSPFYCTLVQSGVYSCPSMSFSKKAQITVTAPITVIVNGSFNAFMLDIVDGTKPLLLDVKGSVYFEKNSTANADIKATGSITVGMNSNVYGDLNSTGGSVSVGKNTTIHGDVNAHNNLHVDPIHGRITGSCSYASTDYVCSGTPPPADALDHFELDHDGTGLTCTPSEVIVRACSGASAGGTCQMTSGGASGTLQVKNTSGTVLASYPFTIPSGQNTATIEVSYPGVATVNFDTTTTGTACWDGDSASCQHVFYNAGFQFDVPDHYAGQQQDVTISALGPGTPPTTCAPAFTTTKTVKFSCAYANPNTGTDSVLIMAGSPTMITTPVACNGGTTDVALPFGADGSASIKVVYPDAGSVKLTAAYPSANMTGSDNFIAVPAKFGIATSGSLVAGSNFTVTITAQNSNGGTTKNYGKETNGDGTRESALLERQLCQPVDGSNGIFSAGTLTFSNGVAQTATANWDEVGTMDIVATNDDYLGLGTGFTITGSSSGATANCSAPTGPFRPHHFSTKLVDPLVFAYSGQPFKLKVLAQNAASQTTTNYYSAASGTSFARAITLSALSNDAAKTANPGPGTLAPLTIAATEFKTGAGAEPGTATAAIAYTYTNAPTKPWDVLWRATDSDNISSASGVEAHLPIRLGRLRMSNAFGTTASNLKIPVRVEYWTGNSWLLNTDDSATVLPATAIALTPKAGLTGVSVLGSAAVSAGQGFFMLSKPTIDPVLKGVGYVNIAANLGAGGTDQSCLATHPATSPGNLLWLRSQNGSCTTFPAWQQDPVARANFGITSPENKATIHVRESFN